MTPINFDSIPQYMRAQPRWTVWYIPEWLPGKDKPDKKLCLPNGEFCPEGYAITKNTGTFEQVRGTCSKNPNFYPGFWMESDNKDGIVFLDYDGTQGNIPPVPQHPTYCERSVYGFGFHVLGWYKGEKPTLPDTKEVYLGGRWIVMTGCVVDGRIDVNDLTEYLAKFNGNGTGGAKKKEPYTAPEAIRNGERNNRLHELACSLANKHLSDEAVLAAVRKENMIKCIPPLPDGEVVTLVASAVKFVKDNPSTKTKRKSVSPDSTKLTEVWAAERFVATLKGDCLYNISTKMWHVWNGRCWEVDDRNIVYDRARLFVKSLFDGVKDVDIEDMLDYIKDAKRINSKSGVANIVSLAAIQLTKRSEDFDADPHTLNMQNGTLVFSQGSFTFHEHRKDDMCSFICNVPYDPSVTVPTVWLNHIKTISADDSELAGNIQDILGYILDGGNPHEYIILMHGGGRNGKSVTLRTILHILGNYGITVNPLTLMEHGNKTISPERIKMRGKRLIVAQEPNKPSDSSHLADTSALDAGFLKAASGKDTIPARELYSNKIEDLAIVGLIAFSTNPLPKVNDSSIAFWERLITIPFGYIIPEWERDPYIESKFKESATGIMNWLIEGFVRSRTGRIKLCNTIKTDIDEYRSTVDEYAGFLGACVIDAPQSDVPARELYTAYVDYQKSHGYMDNNETVFGSAMKTRINHKRTKNGIFYTNIRIQKTQRQVIN